MGDMAALFSGVRFRNTIQNYTEQAGWTIADINDVRVVIRFKMESGRTQNLYIIRYDDTLEFSVPSALAFDTEEEIPHFLSTLLLKRSRENRFGFWCIEEISGKHVYSYMHNAEMQLINPAYFERVSRALIIECDNFEQEISQLK